MTPGLSDIYLIHHSHTDLGYTHDAPIVWELHCRFIDCALDACARDADVDAPHAMHWTIECLAPLLRWLETASPRQVARLQRLEAAGRIEILGLWANMTPLCGWAELMEQLQILSVLRARYGFTIRHAMNCDVNGHPAWFPQVLLEAGLVGLSMAINEHAGGAPPRPALFLWQGPDGRHLPVYNGWHYHMGNWLDLRGPDATRRWMEVLTRQAAAAHWTLPCLMVQITHPFGDNGNVFPELPALVEAWNRASDGPRLHLATPAAWWRAVEPYLPSLPGQSGEWTDYWNFGPGSMPLEVAVARASAHRLTRADAWMAVLAGLGTSPPDPPWTRLPGLRSRAWQALWTWHEHTFGADVSVSRAGSEDTCAQGHHKAVQAWESRSLSLLLQRDAVAELARYVPRSSAEDLVVWNPLPWPRPLEERVPTSVLHPRGSGDDPAASRHSQDRLAEDMGGSLAVGQVPAFGYVVVPRDSIRPFTRPASNVLETPSGRLEVDSDSGGLRSWSGPDGREWVEPGFGCPIWERPDRRSDMYVGRYGVDGGRGWKPGFAARRDKAVMVGQESVDGGLRQHWRLEGSSATASCTMRMGTRRPWVELEYEWDLQGAIEPQSLYVPMPFRLEHAEAFYDGGFLAVRPGQDQIEGCCRDYFTVQQWIALADAQRHVTVASPDAPLFQLGGFHFAENQSHFSLDRPLLLAWLANNYWDTNFTARLERGRARYVLVAGGGSFDPVAAWRLGQEVAHPPVTQALREPPLRDRLWPACGTLLKLPSPPVAVVHLRPAWATPGGPTGPACLGLVNLAEEPTVATLGSALLRLKAGTLCDFFGNPMHDLEMEGDTLHLPMAARQTVQVQLHLGPD